MIYTIKGYALEFHKDRSERTVRRMIMSGLLPENHILVSGFEKPLIIEVQSNETQLLHYYPHVVSFLHKYKPTYENAATYCCENDLLMRRFCELAKVK